MRLVRDMVQELLQGFVRAISTARSTKFVATYLLSVTC